MDQESGTGMKKVTVGREARGRTDEFHRMFELRLRKMFAALIVDK